VSYDHAAESSAPANGNCPSRLRAARLGAAVAELGSLGGIRMYWALTGYLTGFVTAFLLHSLFAGAFILYRLYAIPFLILFVLISAMDTETWFLGRWKRAIERRRADGLLSRCFCTSIGGVAGFLIYPVAALLWWAFLEEEARWSPGVEVRSQVGIVLLVFFPSAALFLAWYLLTRFPKSNDAT
jgi:hypothetical protein